MTADMSNSIETAIAIAFFGTIAIGIGIAKTISKLLLITSLFYIEASVSQTGLEGCKKDLSGLKQCDIDLRILLQP